MLVWFRFGGPVLFQGLRNRLTNQELWVGLAVLAVVTLTYSNHFHNAFHFDDFYRIPQNVFSTIFETYPDSLPTAPPLVCCQASDMAPDRHDVSCNRLPARTRL